MAENRQQSSVTSGRKGMNRDAHQSAISEQEYIFMLNGNYSDQNGNLIALQNEHSNLLCFRLQQGYKVVNVTVDINSDRTFYFLTNPETKNSEIGYVPNVINLNIVDDVETSCSGCKVDTILAEPLETQEQEATCNYIVIMSDEDCENKLGFDINYPISTEIKLDKSGSIIYFTDDLKPRRRIEVDNLEQYFLEDVLCEEGDEDCSCGKKSVPVCLNTDRLLLQKPYLVPTININGVVSGGRLKHGIYSFYVAYTDKNGVELTRYMSPTENVPIKDPNKKIYSQTELDARTGYSIKLKIDNLDITYPYYKVVVRQITSVDGAVSYFEIGNYPTSINEVLYSGDEEKARASSSQITLDYPIYTKAKTVESANNKLFFSDLETQKEINLQPIVNLIGEFAKWRTVMAEEDVYEKGETAGKYKSALRDEVYAKSIRFFTNKGYHTANFPLISRRATSDDILFSDELDEETQKEIIEELIEGEPPTVNNWTKDVYHTLKQYTSCGDVDRYKKWQFYNTAKVDIDGFSELHPCFNGDTTIQEDVVTKRECERVEVFEQEDVSIEIENINSSEPFNIKDWVEDNQTLIESDESYSIFNLQNYLTIITACCEDDTNVTDLFFNSCDNISLVNEKVDFLNIDLSEATIVNVYKDCNTISPNKAPDYCNIYKRDDTNGKEFLNSEEEYDDAAAEYAISGDCDDWLNWYGIYVGGAAQSRRNFLFEREPVPYGGDDCETAEEIPLDSDYQIATHINNIFDVDEPNLVTNIQSQGHATIDPLLDPNDLTSQIKIARCLDPTQDSSRFDDFLHANAVWFKMEGISSDLEEITLNFSKTSKPPRKRTDRDCAFYADYYRVTVFDTACPNGSTVPLEVFLVKEDEGLVKCLDRSVGGLYEGVENIYFAIDTPIFTIEAWGVGTALGAAKPCLEEDDDDLVPLEYITGSKGCFSINAYSPVLQSVNIEGKVGVTVSKICEYEAECDIVIYDDIKCDPQPFSEGEFAYVESTDIYPDNQYLYDSSWLKIKPEDFVNDTHRQRFEEKFTKVIYPDRYILDEDYTDFRCKPIRHFKYPDNEISPITDGYLLYQTNPDFKKNKVFPIGMYIDNTLINTFLDIAVNNNLITQEFRDSIIGYEVFVSDRRLNRSIIGKGLGYDVIRYEDELLKEEINFSNFPFNDNSPNYLLYKDKDRNSYIEHPFNRIENNRFTFHSPEFHFERPSIPFEMKVEGYYYGASKGSFYKVEDHPKMVLLGRTAYRWANALGTLEATLSLVQDTSDKLIQIAQSMFAGVGSLNYGVPVGWAAFGTFMAQRVPYLVFTDINQKRYNWLKIFDENGTPYNFAYNYSAIGYYNKFDTPLNGNKLRSLISKSYLDSGNYTILEGFDNIKFNNLKRESSVFLSTGEGKITYPNKYRRADTSRTTTSRSGLCSDNDLADIEIYPEVKKDIASPYISLKNYLPNQYGAIDSIKWISANYIGDLTQPNFCDVIFGGDIFLSRFALKRKFPFFTQFMVSEEGKMPDLTPFVYSAFRNVAFPRYFIDYKSDMSANFGRFEMPTIQSSFELDCKYEPKAYIKPPSKFYLAYYGIPSFIVESEINLNYRYAENNKEKNFYPNTNNHVEWTQERNVGIGNDNFYFYNLTYSYKNDLYAYRTLPFNYNPEEWDKRFDHWDRTIYSDEDNNEQDLYDAWQVFRANNYNDFGNKYGKLLMLKNIENEKVLGLFENSAVVFNAFNTLQGDIEDVQIGTGGVFATRPTEMFKTPLGYGGTQNRAFTSSPFGHYWVDAKRGRIHELKPSGQGETAISELGMGNWFKENIPFKIRKHFPNLPIDVTDNALNGIGYTLGWDDRYKRVFVTKKDFIPKKDCITYTEGGGFFYNKTQCEETEQVAICPEGYVLNDETNICERNYSITIEDTYTTSRCPEGFVYNEETGLCERTIESCLETTAPASCDQDYALEIYGCEAVRTFEVTRTCPICPEGYTYNSGEEQCEIEVVDCSEIDDMDMVFVMPNNRFTSDDDEIKLLATEITNNLFIPLDEGDVRISVVKYGRTSQITQALTSGIGFIYSAINGYAPYSYEPNVVGGLIQAASALSTSTATSKKIIVFVKDLVNTVTGSPASTTHIQDILDQGVILKASGIDIILVAVGTEGNRTTIKEEIGGCDGLSVAVGYPLSSLGNGVCNFDGQRATYDLPTTSPNYEEIAEDIQADLVICNTTIETTVPNECDCDVVEDNCVCVEEIEDIHVKPSCPDGFSYNTTTGYCERLIEDCETSEIENCLQQTEPSNCNDYDCEDVGGDCVCSKEYTITDIDSVLPEIGDEIIAISVYDEEYFEDVSWTAAYSPLTKSWVSFYSFTPNHYVEFNNYFQTVLNYGEGKEGVWSHLLTNRSFQVFYGEKYEWKIELPFKNNLAKKTFDSIEYKLDVRRYSSEYDYAYRKATFNSAIVYNDRESSGLLKFVEGQANNLFQQINYPKFNSDNWEILTYNEDNTWKFNTFYNIVKDNSNLPIFRYQKNNVEKDINNLLHNYKPTLKNRFRGNWANVIFTQDKETRFKFIFEYLINDTTQYV